MEDISLNLDNGAVLNFKGRLFSESSMYDEENGVLTRHKLYQTEEQEHVYSVVSGAGKDRSRRAYKVAMRGDTCIMSDGHAEMTMPYEYLKLFARSLCGIQGESAPMLDMFEETLRAANC